MISFCSALGALLLPAMVVMRDRARAEQCRDNLRLLGLGIDSFSKNDEQGRFCTGARDWKRDGCPDTYGWVADVVNIPIRVGKRYLICPSNGAPITYADNDLLGAGSLGDLANQPKDGLEWNQLGPTRFEAGLCQPLSGLGGKSPELASGAERSSHVGLFHNRGYRTNYASSWFFARSTVKSMEVNDGRLFSTSTQKGVSGGYLGLRRSDIEGSLVAAQSVPLLGDAALMRGSGTTLHEDIQTSQTPYLYRKGLPLLESFNSGPIAFDPSFSPETGFSPLSTPPRLLLSPRGALCRDIQPVVGEKGNNTDHGGTDNLLWLQDTRAWSTIHGFGQARQVNLLMADFSVKSILDRNGDGYINPGFAIDETMGAAEERRAAYGYSDSRAEFGPADVYSMPVLKLDDFFQSNLE